jgi:hypothetical protein
MSCKRCLDPTRYEAVERKNATPQSLTGRGFFDGRATDWRKEQDGVLRNIAIHEMWTRIIEDGIQLLELAIEAYQLFREQGV